MQRLQPDSYRAALAACELFVLRKEMVVAGGGRHVSPPLGPMVAATRRAFKLARDSRAALAMVDCVIALVGAANATSDAAQMRWAMTAFQEAQTAFGRWRGMLPHAWADPRAASLSVAAQLLPHLHQLIATAEGLAAAGASASPAQWWQLEQQQLEAVAAGWAVAQAAVTREQERRAACCDNCGSSSLALRACSRCRVAKYCSIECQKEHWRRAHKRECQPAAAR